MTSPTKQSWSETDQLETIVYDSFQENALILNPTINKPKKKTTRARKTKKPLSNKNNQLIQTAQNFFKLVHQANQSSEILEEKTIHLELGNILKKIKSLGYTQNECIVIQYFLLRNIKDNLPWMLAADSKLLQLPSAQIISPALNTLLEEPTKHLSTLEFVFLCLKLAPAKHHVDDDLPSEFDQNLFHIIDTYRDELERELSKTTLSVSSPSKSPLKLAIKIPLLLISLSLAFFVGFYCLQNYTDQALLNVLTHN